MPRLDTVIYRWGYGLVSGGAAQSAKRSYACPGFVVPVLRPNRIVAALSDVF